LKDVLLRNADETTIGGQRVLDQKALAAREDADATSPTVLALV
jgi:hypothetical protein